MVYEPYNLKTHCLPRTFFKSVVLKGLKQSLAIPIALVRAVSCVDPDGGGGGQGVWTHPENHKNIGFLSNTGPDSLKNHKTIKPAFSVGSSSARLRNAIQMAFRLRADDGPLIVVFDPPSTHKLKKK